VREAYKIRLARSLGRAKFQDKTALVVGCLSWLLVIRTLDVSGFLKADLEAVQLATTNYE
jgi:hypothetical protein